MPNWEKRRAICTLPYLMKSVFRSAALVSVDRPLIHRVVVARTGLVMACGCRMARFCRSCITLQTNYTRWSILIHVICCGGFQGLVPTAGAHTSTEDSWLIQGGIKDTTPFRWLSPNCPGMLCHCIDCFMLRHIRNCRHYCYYVMPQLYVRLYAQNINNDWASDLLNCDCLSIDQRVVQVVDGLLCLLCRRQHDKAKAFWSRAFCTRHNLRSDHLQHSLTIHSSIH